MCLCLDSAPAADLIEGTAQAWLTAITRGRSWDQHRDTPRVRAAFETLLANAERWPLPRDLLAAMPQAERQPRIAFDRDIPETRAGRCARLQELLGELYNPAVADPNFTPKPACDSASAISPEERRAAEAELTRMHTTDHEDDLPW